MDLAIPVNFRFLAFSYCALAVSRFIPPNFGYFLNVSSGIKCRNKKMRVWDREEGGSLVR